MQINLRNTDQSPLEVVFDDATSLSLDPDDELTLQATLGSSLIVEGSRIQTHGIVSPPYNPSDVDAPGNDPFDEEDDNYDSP